MLETILIIGSLVVFIVCWNNFHRGLKNLESKQTNNEISVNCSKEAKSVYAQKRSRNKGKFVADNPNTSENEAWKKGTKPKVKINK